MLQLRFALELTGASALTKNKPKPEGEHYETASP
jgi:hypothetical protein